jgi:ABC-type polysaccharide/polyol phosphate export permease
MMWAFISAIINDACETFFSSAATIKQLPAALSIYAYRMVYRNLIIFCHNLVIYALIVLLFGIWPGVGNLLLGLIGIALICINGAWCGVFFGLISARFRDIPPIISSFLQVAFFLTPIFWKIEQIPDRAFIVKFNPFYYFIECVRGPLLGIRPPLATWAIVGILTVIGWIFAILLFARFRRRIPYWL